VGAVRALTTFLGCTTCELSGTTPASTIGAPAGGQEKEGRGEGVVIGSKGGISDQL
jgi:hypothetical protein